MDQLSLRDIVNKTTTSGLPRYLLLENYPALMDRGWLPAENEWPEFNELRDEHHRLLDAGDRAVRIATESNARFRAEDERLEAEMAEALAKSRKERRNLPVTPPEARHKEQSDNILRINVAIKALVEFLERAIKEIKERAPELYEGLAAEDSAADQKREEAARLLAEAERVVAGVQRKRLWLNRESGAIPMPHFPFEETAVPLPEEKPDLAAALAGGSAITVEHV